MNNIGQRIKELRKKNDLTQEALADFLGVTYKAVSKWECNMTVPDIALIMPLAKILHVSTDELLCGKPEEIDARRAEFNEHCDNYLRYDTYENYQMALEAVREYPRDYKYLAWLALSEMNVAYHTKFKEDPTMPYSSEMIDRAIRHNNIVIEECNDSGIREKAIWNAMICCKDTNQYEEALKYAEMFPTVKPITRDRALGLCLQGEQLIKHRQESAKCALSDFCIALSRIYWFAEQKEPYVIAALNTEEAVLKTVFPDGNYLAFHKNLCCAYQKRAEFEIMEGDYDKAMEYLQIMMYHAKQLVGQEQSYTCGVFDHLSVDLSHDQLLLYIMHGKDDITKSIFEQLRDRLIKEEFYAPLRNREDFKTLFE